MMGNKSTDDYKVNAAALAERGNLIESSQQGLTND